MNQLKRNEIHQQVVRRAKRVVIKIGAALLTGPHGLRPLFYRGLASATAELKNKGIDVVIVSSGAIACGMHLLALNKRPVDISKKQAVAAAGQPSLMHHYTRFFGSAGLKVAQILVTRDDMEHRGRYENARHAILELFRYGVVPIVNENDSVGVEEIRVGDNDQLSALVAGLTRANMLVILTDTDGLHDRDPNKHLKARRISVVGKIDAKTLRMAKGTLTEKSTGGMITKLKAAQIATRYKIPTWIVNGRNPQRALRELFKGKDMGTLFVPGI